MNFLRLLRYEKSYIYVYLICFLISAAVLFIDTISNWLWGTIYYVFALCKIVLSRYLLIRYQQNVRSIRNMDDEAYDSLSLEAEYGYQQMEEMKNQHIRFILY